MALLYAGPLNIFVTTELPTASRFQLQPITPSPESGCVSQFKRCSPTSQTHDRYLGHHPSKYILSYLITFENHMAFKSSKWDFLISHLFFAAAMVTNQIRFLHSSSESHFGASSRPASDAGSSCLRDPHSFHQR